MLGSKLILPGLMAVLASGAFAQLPNEDCASAITITGTGTTPFDTTGAASEGFDGGGGTCSNSNNQDIFW